MRLSLLDVMVRDFYLQNGMIPVDGFSSEEIKSFHERLESLSLEEKRKAKRKFRKFFRKIEKQYDLNIFSSDSTGKLSKSEKRHRRRCVHRKIKDSVIEEMFK